MTFTRDLPLTDRDTGYSYKVLNVTTRVVIIATPEGRVVETVSHAVAALKYRVA